MHSNKKKIIGAFAVAGIIAAGGSAFTAGGLTDTAPSAFVGGSIEHATTGAVLTATAFTVADNKVTEISLTFDDAAAGKEVSAVLGGVTYACGDAFLANSASTSTCTPADGVEGAANGSPTLQVSVAASL